MFYLAFWRHRSTATVVEARNRQQARARAMARQKRGYGELVSLQQARPEDAALIRRGVWVTCALWSGSWFSCRRIPGQASEVAVQTVV